MRIIVIGAGLSGALLTQGLHGSGIDVSLYEAESAVDNRSQGYRIHIDQQGDLALRSCLPPHLYELALATSGARGIGVSVLAPDLSVQHHFPVPDDPNADVTGRHLTVDRVTLRTILLAELGDRVHFEMAFERYEELPDGRVRAHFTDGTHADADLLVGAEGVHSRIRRQLLPDAKVPPNGQRLVFGKTILSQEVRDLTPEAALTGFSTVTGSDGRRFMPLAAHEFRTDPAEAAARLAPEVSFPDTRDYLMWVVGAYSDALPVGLDDFAAAQGARLRDIAADVVADWDPALPELIRRGEPDSVRATEIRSAEPVAPWKPGPVTLVGDAIHAMIPAGIGAAVALRDAAELCDVLVAARRDGRAVTDVLDDYQTRMLDYGFAAVAASARRAG